jgi:hypothetical protein
METATVISVPPSIPPFHPDQQPIGSASPDDLLRQCQPDRESLNQEIDALLGALQFSAIRAVETALPDFREPGSSDAKLHAALRNDLLNKFNGKRREIAAITKNYVVQQVYIREVVMNVQVPRPLSLGVTVRQ